MKNKFYYLLIKTKTAMNKIGISNSELAKFIGVETKTVSRWFNNKRVPNELNTYKLLWFVYLVLVKGLSATDIRYNFSLKDLSLYTNPYGKGHYEPWNEDDERYPFEEDEYIPDEDFDEFTEEDCEVCEFRDYCKDYDKKDGDDPYDDLFDDDPIIDPALSTLRRMLRERLDCDLDELSEYTNDIIEEVFGFKGCTYQEALRRIAFLFKAFDNYLDSVAYYLDGARDIIVKDYIKVKDFDSFVTFLGTFLDVTTCDENYDTSKEGFSFTLSKYKDPLLKSVNTIDVAKVSGNDDNIFILCEDGSEYHFKDEDFAINTFGTHSLPDMSFIIRFKGEYYSLNIRFDKES